MTVKVFILMLYNNTTETEQLGHMFIGTQTILVLAIHPKSTKTTWLVK